MRLAITPSTGVGYTVASLLHDAGLAVNSRSVESAFGGVHARAHRPCSGCALLYRVRIGRLALYVGVLLLVAAAGGPAAWPWYFTWGLVLLAACPGPQRSLALALGSVVAVFLIKPNGILALPLAQRPGRDRRLRAARRAAVALAPWRPRAGPDRCHAVRSGRDVSQPLRYTTAPAPKLAPALRHARAPARARRPAEPATLTRSPSALPMALAAVLSLHRDQRPQHWLRRGRHRDHRPSARLRARRGDRPRRRQHVGLLPAAARPDRRFGNGELVLRLPSAIAAVATVALIGRDRAAAVRPPGRARRPGCCAQSACRSSSGPRTRAATRSWWRLCAPPISR